MANYTGVIASNIADAAGNKLANGTISFLGTDQNNQPINFQVGGGGQVITKAVTATVTNGAIVGTFVVANPENTLPAGIFYRITITDNTTQQTVATYNLVSFAGSVFNLDLYMQSDLAVVPPSGGVVNGPLVVNGNLSVTGTLLSGSPGAGAETKLGTFSIPATTWSLVHNFGTQAVVVQCYDNSWHQILPDTLTQTDVNTTTATFVQAQAGYMVVVNVGNWTPSIANPNYVVQNPSSSQGITGDYPFTFGGSLFAKRFASLRFADQFGSLAAAYADLPSTGGTVVVPDGYNETLAASITLSKSNSGFWFLGSANITMGAFQIIVPANTFGIFFKGTIPFGDAFASPHGALFSYSGNSNAFQLGTGVGTTSRWIQFENIGINLSGTTGTGIYMTNVVYFSMDRVYVAGSNLIGQTGIVLDGTGNFCGTGTITNPNISFLGTCIKGVSTLNGADAMNAVTIIGGTLATNVVGGIGLNIDSGFQNMVLGTDFESNTIAVKFGADAIDNYVDIRSEANTTDFTAISGSSRNIGKARGNASVVVSDAGTNNHFTSGIDAAFRNLTSNGGFQATDGNGQVFLTASVDSADLSPASNVGGWARAFRVVSVASSNGQDGGAFGVFGSGTTPNRVYIAIPTAGITGFDSTKIICLMNDGTFTIGQSQDTGLSRIAAGSLALGNGSAGSFNGSLKLGTTTVSAGAPTVAAGQVGIGSTTATTATAGAQTLPANPAGFLIINVAGTAMKVPYYNN